MILGTGDFADEDWKEFRSLDVPSPIHLISVPSILGRRRLSL